MGVAETSAIICPACGNSYAFKPHLAGKRVKCKCGGIMHVPQTVVESGDAPDDPYDVAPDTAPGTKPRQTTINADEVLARLGKMPAKPPTNEQLAEQARLKAEAVKAIEENALRDIYLPTVIIAGGIVLAFVEAMTVGKAPPKTIADAFPLVAMRIGLGVGLVIGGMFLAMAMMEVCFIGTFKNCILRFIAIAIGPAALYGLLTHWIGSDNGANLAGPVAGTFGSIAAYALLFWLLMRLDLKDTTVCVVVVFILITFANYTAFKAEAAIKGSWL